MIATGGLLRINARRKESEKAKTQKPRERKKRRRRRSEVVVVKAKLKLCSLSGLVAALGVLVLLVGGVMAALGYWPRDGLFFNIPPQESAAMASVASDGPIAAPSAGAKVEEELRGRGAGGDDDFNQTNGINETMRAPSQSFLEDFLDRYLSSDRLKVLGPLVMGVGIFLFICANAVLHENRDRKTKVISLRDIYSTVIDLHGSAHRACSSSAHRTAANPLNGLVNYVQSRSLEAKPRPYPASLWRRPPGGGGGDAVFSVEQEQRPDTPPAATLTLSPAHRSATWTSFTLPLCRPRPVATRRSHSARAGTGRSSTVTSGVRVGEEQGADGGGRGEEEEEEEEEEERLPLLLRSSTLPARGALCSDAMLLLSCSSLSPSHPSLSSLSHLLSSSSLAPPLRRRSLPTTNFTADAGRGQGTPNSDNRTSAGHFTEELFS